MTKKITYAVDEFGNPLGEAHHCAKLTDADVEFIRDIYDEGMTSYGTLAKVFGVSKAQIRNIITFRRRATTPAAYRTVEKNKRRPLPKDRLIQLGVDYETPELDEDWDNNY